jgi:hypothetical protein
MNPAKLATHRSAYGGIVITTTYSNFLYNVTMTPEGAIKVKHGDWLSKYSAAMYNDFTHIHEFARMDKAGDLKKIQAVNHIFAGETIYHLPTYNKLHHRMVMDDINITASPYTEEQEKQIIRDTLADDYDLEGERLEVLVKIAHVYHPSETSLEIAEIVAESAKWISEETALGATVAFGMTALGLLGAALEGVAIGIEILNANDTDKRLAGMQAICYALPAWAFGDPIPGFPAQLRRNFMAAMGPGTYGIQRVEPAWRSAAEATVRNLEAKVQAKGRSKESYQAFWQALGDFDRKTLVRSLMEGRAEEIGDDIQQMSFMGMDPDLYPN